MPTLVMDPQPGERLVRHVGDRIVIRLSCDDGSPLPPGWRGRLRSTFGRVAAARADIIARHGGSETFAGTAWRDIDLRRQDEHTWVADLPLTEIGWFHAKAFAIDGDGHQHWPAGDDLGIAVHPDQCRSANTIYCAFVRQFGASIASADASDPLLADQLAILDRHGYTVIPPSGTLRDLTQRIPHIVDHLGCRILHLLPITPTPTTYARFGRYGSPYAVQDLIAIDPALVVFDKRSTGIDQLRELVDACHRRDCQVFLDVVLNHTGWGSTLQERYPEFFVRNADGSFHSPGAWGNTWEDLVEIDHAHPDLWDVLAEALLVWCRRGIDGFRCDAGYMIPVAAWQYITARIRQEFPDTVFLLEGLGGAWSTTATLLAQGGLQWAYSELFQNYSPREVSGYLDHLIASTGRVGTLVHYSETHDNDRLAKRGRTWSLLRNRLCALLSLHGSFGFTAGVEWLCREKINVHGCGGLNWDASDNIVQELSTLNHLISDHPCWFDGARLERLSEADAPVLIVSRRSADGRDHALIVANLDLEAAHTCDPSVYAVPSGWDLLTQRSYSGPLTLSAAEVRCLSATQEAVGLGGESYRHARARAAAAYRLLSRILPPEAIGPIAWQDLAARLEANPPGFLAAIARIDPTQAAVDLGAAIDAAARIQDLPPFVVWTSRDQTRVLCVPHGQWLLLRDGERFTARLHFTDGRAPLRVRSMLAGGFWWSAFAPQQACDADLVVEAHARNEGPLHSTIRFLAKQPSFSFRDQHNGILLLTNGRGAMMHAHADLGRITSKYDCILAANLHPRVPVDRHVLIKRLRAWCVADGFITPLDGSCLAHVEDGGAARWVFVANAGDGRTVEVHLTLAFSPDRNAMTVDVRWPEGAPLWGDDLPDAADVFINLRFDLEDRSFHAETVRSDGLDQAWTQATTTIDEGRGFAFAPAADRRLHIVGPQHSYHQTPEWSTAIPHPIEAERGMAGSGDAWSPGWFRSPLPRGSATSLAITVNDELPTVTPTQAVAPDDDAFLARLAISARDYLVRRDDGHTVIAGYPWFLDWGRDTLICARGLLALGHHSEVLGLLRVFGKFEAGGTLPNCIHGEDASNRDTSDAPLWAGVVCEEAAALLGPAAVYDVDVGGRCIRDVLAAIAGGYLAGTSNGIRVDIESGLVWSPSHFTWMDTNYPAGTPRVGYPIEIQVLWWRLLRQLSHLNAPSPTMPWAELADRVATTIERLYWLEDQGWLADTLIAPSGTPAEAAIADTVLRSNAIFAVSLGLLHGRRAQRLVEATREHLIIPGAIRSLAPLPARPPHPIRNHEGALLNDPDHPYWGRYEGDEDSRRKPAYHNGTAWVWPFPSFCEALAAAYEWSDDALATARSYLASTDRLLGEGCLGQLPEILDGDIPHRQRGCDAQAWSVTETARVWKLVRQR